MGGFVSPGNNSKWQRQATARKDIKGTGTSSFTVPATGKQGYGYTVKPGYKQTSVSPKQDILTNTSTGKSYSPSSAPDGKYTAGSASSRTFSRTVTPTKSDYAAVAKKPAMTPKPTAASKPTMARRNILRKMAGK